MQLRAPCASITSACSVPAAVFDDPSRADAPTAPTLRNFYQVTTCMKWLNRELCGGKGFTRFTSPFPLPGYPTRFSFYARCSPMRKHESCHPCNAQVT